MKYNMYPDPKFTAVQMAPVGRHTVELTVGFREVHGAEVLLRTHFLVRVRVRVYRCCLHPYGQGGHNARCERHGTVDSP